MARSQINDSAFDDPRLRAVADYVRRHLADSARLSLRDAARIANLCPEYFCRLFHDRVGVAFVAWQCAVRMERARQLIVSEQSRSTAAVGLRVGYENPTTFGRLFKRHHGVTPGRLRKLMRTSPALRPVLSTSVRLCLALKLCEWGVGNRLTLRLLSSLAQRLDDFCAEAARKSKAIDKRSTDVED